MRHCMDDWERGMTMKKFDCSIGKKLAVPLLCFAFLLPAGECALGAEPPKWTENKADVGIYQTELSDFYEISFLNLERRVDSDTKNLFAISDILIELYKLRPIN